jgi:glycosidase
VGTPEAALETFRKVVKEADRRGLDVFIDVAFNHAGRDVVLGQSAVDLGLAAPAEAGQLVRTARPGWATSRRDFRAHASGPDDLALFAPTDRLGEHRWFDAGVDWFFGDYSSLGPKPGADTSRGGALDEHDFFYTDLDPVGGYDHDVEDLWRYFAHVLPYWLDRTDGGLDGIRADFAQGLPPQAWEYIINKTRQQRWDFVFLAEALDPDEVRYRVNRHFDLITTVDHWLYRRSELTMGQLVSSLEAEAGLYGYNAAVMHNGTSHDEEGNGDAWLMTARYAVAAALYGAPMVYMGQPLGVPGKIDFQGSWADIQGYWDRAEPNVFEMYRRINRARETSAPLRAPSRYFLGRQTANGFNEEVFSIARSAGNEVVLAFVNLRNRVLPPDVFAIPDAVPLDLNARYQAYNLLADDPSATVWPQARSGADIRRDGVFVRFSLPNEAQYLQLRRVE